MSALRVRASSVAEPVTVSDAFLSSSAMWEKARYRISAPTASLYSLNGAYSLKRLMMVKPDC